MKIEEQKPSNPPAFACIDNMSFHQPGMTLRDYFAANAMQSIIDSNYYSNCTGNNGMPVPEFVAKESYLMADAMLKQREA